MFDIGWTELLVIAVVLIVVVGPKDLPPMIRAFGKMTANFRKMAGDFRTQFDEALREADMDDVRKTISDAQKLNPTNALRDAINPLRQMGQDIKSDLQKATQIPNPLADNTTELSPADAEAQQAIEGVEPVSAAPEVPTSVEPSAAPTNAPAIAAAPVASAAAPATPATAVADTKTTAAAKPVASTTPVAAAPTKVEPAAAKPRAPRKAAVKAEGEATARSRSAKSSTGSAVAETDASAVKPKRAKAASKTVVETASVAVETPVAKAPARKRAAKKTDTPKDEA